MTKDGEQAYHALRADVESMMFTAPEMMPERLEDATDALCRLRVAFGMKSLAPVVGAEGGAGSLQVPSPVATAEPGPEVIGRPGPLCPDGAPCPSYADCVKAGGCTREDDYNRCVGDGNFGHE